MPVLPFRNMKGRHTQTISPADLSSKIDMFAKCVLECSTLTFMQVYEVLDNCIDEVQGGYADTIKVRHLIRSARGG